MAQTPVTSATPYCTPAKLFVYFDYRVAADCLRDDDGPRPTRAALLDTSEPTGPGAVLAALCLAASGRLESACLARSLYHPDDLNALTGGGAAHREQVTAGLVIQDLFQRRNPGTGKPDDWSAVQAAREALDRLGKGERVFATAENRDAGAGFDAVEPVNETDPNRTVNRASRFFGTRTG